MVTKTQVGNYLQQLEIDEGVTIFYCILGGSRAFNYNGGGSDYDIFFVFDGEIPYIRKDELFQGEKIMFKGYRRDIYTEYTLDASSMYKVDSLRCTEKYYDTEDYHNTLLAQLDEHRLVDGVSLINHIRNSLIRIIKQRYYRITLAGTNVLTRHYRIALYCYSRYRWLMDNWSIFYPLDKNTLFADLNTEDWFLEAVNMFANDQEITSRNSTIDTVLDDFFQNVELFEL